MTGKEVCESLKDTLKKVVQELKGKIHPLIEMLQEKDTVAFSIFFMFFIAN